MTHKIVPDIVKNQALKFLKPDATARVAARLMGSKWINAILVTENDRLVGIMTERDLKARVVASSLAPDVTILSDVMTESLDTGNGAIA